MAQVRHAAPRAHRERGLAEPEDDGRARARVPGVQAAPFLQGGHDSREFTTAAAAFPNELMTLAPKFRSDPFALEWTALARRGLRARTEGEDGGRRRRRQLLLARSVSSGSSEGGR